MQQCKKQFQFTVLEIFIAVHSLSLKSLRSKKCRWERTYKYGLWWPSSPRTNWQERGKEEKRKEDGRENIMVIATRRNVFCRFLLFQLTCLPLQTNVWQHLVGPLDWILYIKVSITGERGKSENKTQEIFPKLRTNTSWDWRRNKTQSILMLKWKIWKRIYKTGIYVNKSRRFILNFITPFPVMLYKTRFILPPFRMRATCARSIMLKVLKRVCALGRKKFVGIIPLQFTICVVNTVWPKNNVAVPRTNIYKSEKHIKEINILF